MAVLSLGQYPGDSSCIRLQLSFQPVVTGGHRQDQHQHSAPLFSVFFSMAPAPAPREYGDSHDLAEYFRKLPSKLSTKFAIIFGVWCVYNLYSIAFK